MIISGVDIGLDKIAYEIGRKSAEEAFKGELPLSDKDITGLLQAYVNAVVQVKQKSQNEIEALLR